MNANIVYVLLTTVNLLSACGGGGSSSSVANNGTPSVEIVPSVVSTKTDVLNELNRIRISAEVNPLIQNDKVELAAENHAKYLSVNSVSIENTHREDPSKYGFTGIRSADRIRSTGYLMDSTSEVWASEVISVGTSSWDMLTKLRSLMNAPYHGIALLSGAKDIGISSLSTSAGTWFVINVAVKLEDYIFVPEDKVVMWPCNNINNILNKSIDTETPNPIAGRNLMTQPIGTPIYIQINEGKQLVLLTYEIRNLTTNQVEKIAKVLGQDVADGLFKNQMAILPDAPLATNTPYSVSVTGLNADQPFSKTCKFTTGG